MDEASDVRTQYETLSGQYEEGRRKHRDLIDRYESVNSRQCSWLFFWKITSLNGEIVSAISWAVGLQQSTEILLHSLPPQKRGTIATQREDIETLLGDISRQLLALDVLHKSNSHLYMTSTLVYALLGVGAGLLSITNVHTRVPQLPMLAPPLVQVLLTTTVTASMYFLVGISFAIIYSTARFFHFAQAIVVTSAPYILLVSQEKLGADVVLALCAAIGVTVMLGSAMNRFVYQPLRSRNSTSLVFLLASLGIYFALQNLVSLTFGDNPETIRSGPVEEGHSILGARITTLHILTIAVAIVIALLLVLLFRRTRFGHALRAVACAPDLAVVSGIDSDRVFLWAFAVASGIAGIAGILIAFDVDMTPTMGMNALMMGVVAVIIGGVDSIPGIALGALLIAMAQQFGAWYFGSRWQDAIAFAILLVFLLVRPQGFFGKKIKKATV